MLGLAGRSAVEVEDDQVRSALASDSGGISRSPKRTDSKGMSSWGASLAPEGATRFPPQTSTQLGRPAQLSENDTSEGRA